MAEHDPIVAAHYAGFDYDHARIVRLTLARTVYVSYRIGNRIYWTRHRLTLHKGEKVITDGRMTARTRCANRVEETPQQAAAPVEPPVVKFDQPVRAATGTAVQSPPVPFESALLTRPGVPGVRANRAPELVRSIWWWRVGADRASAVALRALCVLAKRKNTLDAACCPGDEPITVSKKKNIGPCGGPGEAPEPATWLMFASGLAVNLLAGSPQAGGA